MNVREWTQTPSNKSLRDVLLYMCNISAAITIVAFILVFTKHPMCKLKAAARTVRDLPSRIPGKWKGKVRGEKVKVEDEENPELPEFQFSEAAKPEVRKRL